MYDDGKVSITINPQYMEWTIKDWNLLTWINSTLSEVVLPCAVGLNTFKSIWNALDKWYASLSRSHTIQLKGTSSMQDCLQ